MSAFRIFLALTVLAVATPAAAQDSEEVVAASRPVALPSQSAQDKARADAKARAEAAAKPLTTEEQIAAWLADAPKLDSRDRRLTDEDTRLSDRNQVHGQVSVSVGTGGYRSAYASSVIPFGENGLLGISVSQTDFGKDGFGDGRGYAYGGYPSGGYTRFGRDGYGLDGYDSLGYGYGYGYGPRRGRSQSLAVSIDMTGARHSRPDTPEGCAPGFRDGDRYIEPLWVTRMRGDGACEAAAATTDRR